ncbi:hypothetical protein IKF76_00300 [Candidatus Saccharibacteria bacterium]|nr:hypothetical protein [Candidatus Saccharibacteria bacterium]
MIAFFKKHRHLYATLAPVVLGLVFLVACIPAITQPIGFAEADALMNVFHAHVWGLRVLPLIIICLILVVAFHAMKITRGLRFATITGAVMMAILAVGVYILHAPTKQELALPNIITDVQQYDSEPQTIYFDIPNFNTALFYDTSAYPVADLSTRPTGNHHFWLIVPAERLGENLAETTEAIQIPNGYYIADQLSNDYYTAVNLDLVNPAP